MDQLKFGLLGVPSAFTSEPENRMEVSCGEIRQRLQDQMLFTDFKEFGYEAVIKNFDDIEHDPSNGIRVLENLRSQLAQMLRDGYRPVLFGGDHTLTFYSFMALNEIIQGRYGLIVIDGHVDAKPANRVGLPGTVIRDIVQLKLVKPRAIAICGARAIPPIVYSYVKEKGINLFVHSEIFDAEFLTNLKRCLNEVEQIYLSIDIDILDPAFAPGVLHRLPGGLTTRELLTLVRSICTIFDVQVCDIVEFCPALDIGQLTADVVARLVYETIWAIENGDATRQ